MTSISGATGHRRPEARGLFGLSDFAVMIYNLATCQTASGHVRSTVTPDSEPWPSTPPETNLRGHWHSVSCSDMHGIADSEVRAGCPLREVACRLGTYKFKQVCFPGPCTALPVALLVASFMPLTGHLAGGLSVLWSARRGPAHTRRHSESCLAPIMVASDFGRVSQVRSGMQPT